MAHRRKLLLLLFLRQKQVEKKRRMWSHEIDQKGRNVREGHRLVQELKLHGKVFKMDFRFTKTQFEELIEQLGPFICKQNTNFRRAISVEQRLAICLRFLASGDSHGSVADTYHVGRSTVQNIVKEVCEAIWEVLMPKYLPEPTPEKWKSISECFLEKLRFPNCVGAIGAKHVIFQAPPRPINVLSKCKKSFYIMLMAVVDPEYKFVVVDVGSAELRSDKTTLQNCGLYKSLEQEHLSFPPAQPLPGAPALGPIPLVVVGDETFPLKTYLIRPFTGRNVSEEKKIFNARLCGARAIVENAFDILASRWRVYYRRITHWPDTVTKIVKATVVLHNILQNDIAAEVDEPDRDDRPDFPDIAKALQDVQRFPDYHSSQEAIKVRDVFKKYFCTENSQGK
uniref:Zgc:194221 n=1 Tax=Eptatretus burgeri TaxID=7764 RepID=A0A8C4QKB3_EPTBU